MLGSIWVPGGRAPRPGWTRPSTEGDRCRRGVEVSVFPGTSPASGAEGTAGTVVHIFLLIVCAVAIYVSCEWFVNAVEWLGVRLNIGPLAVGTILAAFGTALPESVVTFVAVVFGHDHASKDIGIGAAMGGPLVLATVSYGG